MLNQPQSGNDMPRFAGIPTMMRLPAADQAHGLDAAFVGIPLDIGTSNRSGTRYGPRQIRRESVMIRPYNMGTGSAPFERLQVADLGMSPSTLTARRTACSASRRLTTRSGARLHAVDARRRPHADAAGAARRRPSAWPGRADPRRCAFRHQRGDVRRTAGARHHLPPRVRGGAAGTRKVVQIGLRGSGYAADDFDWSRRRGFRVVPAEACWHRSLTPLMTEIREQMGDAPVYLSFDIDGLDPAFAPGTGTPEVGGLSVWQGLEIVRGCHGLNTVGGDVVEVSPPYDRSGNTALLAANLLFEMLCVLPAR